jgi:hypothetical protein
VQVGAENRNKLILALVLMVLAVVLVGRWLFSSTASAPAAAPPPSTAGPAAHRAAPPRVLAGGKKVNAEPRSLDPTLRYDWLKASEDTKYHGAGRNIFLAAALEIPKPIAPAGPKHVEPEGPPPAPPPPPINLKFFGFASKPGEPKRIFLSQGEDVFIAGEGEIVDRRYKILRITPVSVEVEDVLNSNRQSIPLTQG